VNRLNVEHRTLNIERWKEKDEEADILSGGAQRHHYSMFDVGRSMFDV